MAFQQPSLVATQEATQDRERLQLTESELFHAAALNRRMEQTRSESPSTQSSDSLLDQTLNRSTANRRFNLNQFLENSVYPAEWAESSQSNDKFSIFNASYLIDHLGNSKSLSHRTSNDTSSMPSQRYDSVEFDPNETFVDEDLVLSLTQKASNTTLMNETLNENENEVLDIFEELEEDDEPTHDETLRIDDDSVLAPLSQRPNVQTNASQHQMSTDRVASFEEDDSDDDLLNEFSMSMIDCMPTEKHE